MVAGLNRIDPDFYYAGAQMVTLRTDFSAAARDADELEKAVRARLDAEDIKWDVETVTLMASGVSPFLANHMRFFDLAILPLPYEKGRSQIDVSVFEGCMFGASLPVIAVPNAFAAC